MNTYAYVTYQDIRGISDFDGTTVIAVKAPPETRLEVPRPEEVSSRTINLYFHLLFSPLFFVLTGIFFSPFLLICMRTVISFRRN